MHAEEAPDPLRTLTVDRVERPDGRYLLFYRWPDDPNPVDGGAPDPSHEGEDV